ncbi:MAG: 50S ribosomal protein L25 [Candidatus Omnitrophica bacterium]|nr:50S ribosomal protein L25 [Candidatus Omnitrophota bacterium]
MERIQIETQKRVKLGKEANKKMRRGGEVPAVVYDKEMNVPIRISHDALMKLRAVHFAESVIVDMTIQNGTSGKDSVPVIIKALQHHPLSEEIIHIDFLKVSLTEKIQVHVPVSLKGEIKEVKEGEAVLEQMLREVEIECLPTDIPDKIQVDVSELTIGHSFHVADIKTAPEIKVVTPGEDTIATVVYKEEEPIETPEAVEGEEPEVIKAEGAEEEGAEGEEKGEGGEETVQKEPKEEKKKE